MVVIRELQEVELMALNELCLFFIVLEMMVMIRA